MEIYWIKKFNYHLGIIKDNYTEEQIEEIEKNGEFGDRLKNNDYFVYLNPNVKGPENTYVADLRCWTSDTGVTYVDDRIFTGNLEEVMKEVEAWVGENYSNRSEEIRVTKDFF